MSYLNNDVCVSPLYCEDSQCDLIDGRFINDTLPSIYFNSDSFKFDEDNSPENEKSKNGDNNSLQDNEKKNNSENKDDYNKKKTDAETVNLGKIINKNI